jgi:RNA polymerase sigma-70 factor (ECF subfamily)
MSAASLPNMTGFDPARLIEAHQAGVWRYLRALGCEPALADDLTQDTFLAILQVPFQDFSHSATAAYLRKTAFNSLVSYKRRAKRAISVDELEVVDENWSRWAADDNAEALLEALRDCFKGLGERAKLALELRFREKRSRSSIAASLQMTEHGAKNLMQRAKHKLRQCIESKLESKLE